MSCTDNFIGIRVCGAGTSKSGYYIEDLEGINLQSAADIAVDSDAVSLINSKIQFAIKQTVNDAAAKIPNLQFNVLAESLRSCDFSGTKTANTPSVTVTRNNYKSPLSNLVLNRIIVKLGQDYTGDLQVLDGGQVVETISISATADTDLIIDGLAVIVEGDLSVRINSAGLEPYTAYRYGQAWDAAVGSCCLRPWDSPFLQMTDGYGIVADVSVVCSDEKLLCRLLYPLKDAILYRTGIEILNEWLATDRVNFLAVNGQEWAENKKTEWAQAYNAKLSFALSSAALKTLQKIDPVCFDCGGNKFGYAL